MKIDDIPIVLFFNQALQRTLLLKFMYHLYKTMSFIKTRSIVWVCMTALMNSQKIHYLQIYTIKELSSEFHLKSQPWTKCQNHILKQTFFVKVSQNAVKWKYVFGQLLYQLSNHWSSTLSASLAFEQLFYKDRSKIHQR